MARPEHSGARSSGNKCRPLARSAKAPNHAGPSSLTIRRVLAAPADASPADVLALQRHAGNQAVTAVLQRNETKTAVLDPELPTVDDNLQLFCAKGTDIAWDLYRALLQLQSDAANDKYGRMITDSDMFASMTSAQASHQQALQAFAQLRQDGAAELAAARVEAAKDAPDLLALNDHVLALIERAETAASRITSIANRAWDLAIEAEESGHLAAARHAFHAADGAEEVAGERRPRIRLHSGKAPVDKPGLVYGMGIDTGANTVGGGTYGNALSIVGVAAKEGSFAAGFSSGTGMVFAPLGVVCSSIGLILGIVGAVKSGRRKEQLEQLSRTEGVTLFMTLLAGFQTLLRRYSGQDDVCVATPAATRDPDAEAVMGCFMNTLVLRGDLAGDPTFRELLQRTRTVSLDAFEHQDVPFERVVEALRTERGGGHTPLFEAMIVLHNARLPELRVAGLDLRPVDVESGTAVTDLALLLDTGDRLRGVLEYNADRFDRDTVRRMLGHLRTLLEGVVADPGRRLSELPLMTRAERHRVLVAWNDTAADLGAAQCLHELVAAQVRATPHAVAVVSDTATLTYADLDRRSNRLAHHLRGLGVEPERVVGVCMERSPDAPSRSSRCSRPAAPSCPSTRRIRRTACGSSSRTRTPPRCSRSSGCRAACRGTSLRSSRSTAPGMRRPPGIRRPPAPGSPPTTSRTSSTRQDRRAGQRASWSSTAPSATTCAGASTRSRWLRPTPSCSAPSSRSIPPSGSCSVRSPRAPGSCWRHRPARAMARPSCGWSPTRPSRCSRPCPPSSRPCSTSPSSTGARRSGG